MKNSNWKINLLSSCFHKVYLTPSEIQDFSPNFLVRNFSENAQFLKIFVRIARKSAEIRRLRKISSPENYVEKLAYGTMYRVQNSENIYNAAQ